MAIVQCLVEGCERPKHANGLCSLHRHRQVRYGDPLMTTSRPRSMPFADWFRSMFVPNGECLDWTGGQGRGGYGVVSHEGSNVSTHRLAWELSRGAVPDDLHVLHMCDRRLCGNVDHLFLGTNLDNVRDRQSKGRNTTLSGSSNGFAKLTEADVHAIMLMRMQGLTYSQIGAAFGVDQSNVGSIVKGRTWRGVAPRIFTMQ